MTHMLKKSLHHTKNPIPFNYTTITTLINPLAMWQIILKPSPKTLPIAKNPHPLPILLILLKPPLIPHPLVLHQMQIPIINLPIRHLRLLVIQYPIPM